LILTYESTSAGFGSKYGYDTLINGSGSDAVTINWQTS